MTAPAVEGGLADGLRRAARGLHWYVREVSGATAYERHLERHDRDSPGVPPVDERTFWRERMDGRDGEPPQRCC